MLILLIFPLLWFFQWASIDGPLDSLSESFHVEDLYTYWTRDAIAEESFDVQSNLVLVDVSGIETRGELAAILDEIADAEPRILALDLIFAPLSMADSAQDRQLVMALERFPHLILASNCHSDLQGAHEERSFFADLLPNGIEGEVWLAGMVVRQFSPIIEENGRPTFAYCIAEAMGVPVVATTEAQNICYFPTSVFTWKPAKETINMQYLKDKVIVLGDTQDLRDFYKVPLFTNANGRMSGVMIHLASVLTLAADRPVCYVSNWLNLVLGLLLLWVLCWIFCLWGAVEWGLDNWIQMIVAFIMSALLMGVGACIFLANRVVFSAFYFLIGCPLASFAKDIVDFGCNNGKIKQKR